MGKTAQGGQIAALNNSKERGDSLELFGTGVYIFKHNWSCFGMAEIGKGASMVKAVKIK